MSMLIMATAFSSGSTGFSDVVVGAQQADLLAGEGQKQDAAPVLRPPGEPAGQFDHPGSPRGVVVGARVDRPSLATGPWRIAPPARRGRSARR